MLWLWWSAIFSTMEKLIWSGPDSIIRRWIPELSSGCSIHTFEWAWLCVFGLCLFLHRVRPAFPGALWTQLPLWARHRSQAVKTQPVLLLGFTLCLSPNSHSLLLLPSFSSSYCYMSMRRVCMCLCIHVCTRARVRVHVSISGEGQWKLGRDAILLSCWSFSNPFLILTWG